MLGNAIRVTCDIKQPFINAIMIHYRKALLTHLASLRINSLPRFDPVHLRQSDVRTDDNYPRKSHFSCLNCARCDSNVMLLGTDANKEAHVVPRIPFPQLLAVPFFAYSSYYPIIARRTDIIHFTFFTNF